MTGRPSLRIGILLGLSLTFTSQTLCALAGPPQIPIQDCICDPVHRSFGYYPTRWRRWPGNEYAHGPMVPVPQSDLPIESLPTPVRQPQPGTIHPPGKPGLMPEEAAPPGRQPTPLGLPTMPNVRPGLPDAEVPPPTEGPGVAEPMPPEVKQPGIPTREDLQQLPDDDAPKPPGSLQDPLSLPPDSRDPLQPPPDESSYNRPGHSLQALPRLQRPMSTTTQTSNHVSNEWRRAVREASREPHDAAAPTPAIPDLFEPAEVVRPVREPQPADNTSVQLTPTTRFDTHVRPAASWQTPTNTNEAATSRQEQRAPLRANPLR